MRGPTIGGGDDRVVRQPGQRRVAGFLARILAERLVGFQLQPVALDALLLVRVGAAALSCLAQRTAQ